MKDKIITAILVIIVGIILLPLAKFNEKQETQELKGFSARDIQFIESIGFVSNGDGSWTATTNFTVTNSYLYEFDYKPNMLHNGVIRTEINSIRCVSNISLGVISGNIIYTELFLSFSPIILYGGDVS